MKTYYKVLYRTDHDKTNHGDLLSMGEIFGRTKALVIKYNPPGEETVAPRGTKLFVFDTYEHARDFRLDSGGYYGEDYLEIWEIEAEATKQPNYILRIRYGLPNPLSLAPAQLSQGHQQELRTFWWELCTGGKLTFETTRPPVGTLVCESVILKRKVT